MKTNLRSTYRIVIFVVFISLLIQGCGGNDNTPQDTPISGEITISVDETFAPIIKSQVDTFQKIYSSTKIIVHYCSENEAVNDLLSDSARLAMIPRKLTTEEGDYFTKQSLYPKGTKIFYDAIAIIVNNSNKDTLLSFDKLKDILTGKVKKWKDIDPSSSLSDIQIIFDNPNSSTVRFIKEKIEGELAKKSFAVKTNPDVIEYVSKNKNAIGFVGVNWISDRDDSTAHKFLNTVKVIGLKSNMPNVDPNEYYQPYQAYIAQKYYPLIREVYIISREARAGLGTGFSAFVAGEKGQRIFLKAGLVPATMPIRLVETYQ